MSELKPVFFEKLIQMCNRLNVNPADMLLIFTLESGLDSSSITSHTVGLNQFYGDSYRNYFDGSREEYAKLPPENQLDSIEKYFRNIIGNTSITSAAQLYCANLLPISLKLKGVMDKDRSTIIAEKGSGKKYSDSGTLTYGAVYHSNAGLDVNKDDKITYGDLEDMLKRKTSDPRYIAALEKLSSVGKKSYESSVSSGDSSASEKGGYFFGFLEMAMMAMKQFTKGLGLAALASSLEEKDYLIKIASPNLEDNLEVARILSIAYEELLNAKCKTYTDGNYVEINCKTAGDEQKYLAAIDQFSNAVLDEFSNKTGNNYISLNVFANKTPSYNELDIKTAESNYRKFQLKILGNKND